MRASVLFTFLAFALLLPSQAEMPKYRVTGHAWTDFGRIMKASDSLLPGGNPNLVLNLNGNNLVSAGGQFTVHADLTENWEAAFGFGAHRVGHARGRGETSFLAINMYHHFLTESRLTWHAGEKENQYLSFSLGSFPFKYNAEVQNLGLYLFRGPVYPGILMGGYQDFGADSTKATQLGVKLSHVMGDFSQDIILNSERDIPPTFDLSLGYVARFKAFGALELGAGANFYRAIAYDEKLMVPGKLSNEDLNFKKLNYVEVDSATNDTVFFTHRGVKVMGMASLDLKPLFNIESMGKDELKVYAEGAILGVQNYGKAYNDISKRIPVMFGISLPTWKLLDRLSIEVEHYKSPYRNDLARIGNNNVVADWTRQAHPIPSPKPLSDADYGIRDGKWVDVKGDTIVVAGTGLARENVTTDDFKWSVNIEKAVSGHIRFSAQVANDHYRPRPVSTTLISSSGGTAEAFSESSNWYFMLRMGYFF